MPQPEIAASLKVAGDDIEYKISLACEVYVSAVICEVILPDYKSTSIVNLMSSLVGALGDTSSPYAPLAALGSAELASVRNVVLIVIDGLGFEYLNSTGAGSALQQNIRARITSVFPSTTASAITTFLTGLAPQQHALTGWFMYLREIGMVTTILPFKQRSSAKPLHDFGVQPGQLFDQKSVFDCLHVACYAINPARILNSEFNVAHCGSAVRIGYSTLQQFVHAIASAVRSDGARKFVYAYYPEIDSAAHQHGIQSPQVAAEFAALDRAFADLQKALAGSHSILIVTADHGFIDRDPSQAIKLEHHPRLAQTLLQPLCGEPRVAYCYVDRAQTEQFEKYVTDVFAEKVTLMRSEDLVAQGYFGHRIPHPRLAERIGDYTLIMNGNYTIEDRLPGERRHTQIGVHGGLSESEMMVPLIITHT